MLEKSKDYLSDVVKQLLSTPVRKSHFSDYAYTPKALLLCLRTWENLFAFIYLTRGTVAVQV